ncbi:MAG: glycoside hydrolase family 99-like domain-containing protein [Anaerolineae bacterium]|nr:MAG: glycoside hydrolase family 99-like domain-containing protein [Anaerolineae bacterium]
MRILHLILLVGVVGLTFLAQPEGGFAQPGERLVLAFYYTWYDENTWQPGLVPDMPLTPYVSREPSTIERHVVQAQAAGIDGFVVSWWGPQEENNQTEINLRVLLDVAQECGFLVTVDFELTSPFYASQADVVAALRYLMDTHARHPAFLRYGGQPLIFFWRQQRYDVATWRAIRQEVDPSQGTLWMAEGVDLAYQDVFDGHHLYNTTWNPPTDPAYTAAKFRRLVDAYNAAHGTHKLWVATAMPGYDDTHIAGRPGTYSYPRQDGAYYRQTWEAAVASRPEMIVITSFNEWREGTMIEPSVTYGQRYLDLTAELAAWFKGGAPPPVPTATDAPTSLPVPGYTSTPTGMPVMSPTIEGGTGTVEATTVTPSPTATFTPTPWPTATGTARPTLTATATSTTRETPAATPTGTPAATSVPASAPELTPTATPRPSAAPAQDTEGPFLCASLFVALVLPLAALLKRSS